jgi:phosphate uptake regulator
MQARKVLEMGGGTLLVSIPKQWAVKNRITKGSTVAVEELSERKLVVSPMTAEDTKPREITIAYPKEQLEYLVNDLTGAYLLGFDSIKIASKTPISREDRDRVKSTLSRLIGLEIMDEDSRGISLQFLPEPSTLDPEKIVKRMVSISEGMMRDTAESLGERDTGALATVQERDDEVDRLYFLLVRAIRSASIDPEIAERFRLKPVQILDYRVLASFLESLGDTIAELSSILSRESFPALVVKELVEIATKLEIMEDLAIQSFLVRGAARPRENYLEVRRMSKEITEATSKIPGLAEAPAGSMVEVVSLVERINKIFVDISDLSLPTYPFPD